MKIEINQKRLIHEFLHLVSFDSESFQERNIADYLIQQLELLKLEVWEDDVGYKFQNTQNLTQGIPTGNIYARFPAHDPEQIYSESILLSAHMDTVSPGNKKKALVKDNGIIVSEGETVLGADDASGIAEILEILRLLFENNIPHPEIEVIFTVAEESYAQGSKMFDYSKIQSKIAYVLDLTGKVGLAAIAAPTIISVKVEIFGKASHAGFEPEKGIHAIKLAANAMGQLPNGYIDADTTVNFGTIQGGVARNIVPDYCMISGEIRSMKHEKALAQAAFIKKIFCEEGEKASAQVKIDITEEFQGYQIREDEPVANKFSRACKKLGLCGMFQSTFGGSDNNHFVSHGIRGIVLANAMNKVHTVDEYTSVDEMVGAAQLLLEIVLT